MNERLNMVLLAFVVLFTNLSIAQIPLEIGNRWEFQDHEWDASGYNKIDTIRLNIYADTLINSEKYFRITGNFWIHDFVRSDSLGVYFYDTINNKEWLFYKFNLAEGEYVQNGYKLPPSGPNKFITVYKSIDDTTSYFGQFTRRMRFTVVRGVDDAYSVEISPKFGFLSIDASDFMYNRNIGLLGCKIGNQIYGTLTTVDDSKQVPGNYKLFRNYPNPFNPITTIEYQLTGEEIVTLKVYDLLGTEIKTLLTETSQNAGVHKVAFDGVNLSSGIYLSKLTVKGNPLPLFNKMILLK